MGGPPEKYAPVMKLPSARETVKRLIDVENTSDTIVDLAARLGIPYSKVDDHYKIFLNQDDPLIKNQFEYELGSAVPIIKDRLSSALPFWANYLHAPKMVLDWIENGVKIDFLVEPKQFHCKNNKSALKAPDFVTKAVQELVDFGLVEEVEEKPHVINALSVAYNANGKPRLCLDMSHVNNHSVSPSFKLDDQNVWFEVARTGLKFNWVFDFKSCFHQILVHKTHTKYFGFHWTNPKTNVSKSYVFVVVPFGLLKAPYVCKHLFKPLIKTWRRLSIPTCLFYDDCISGAYTEEAAKLFMDRQRIDLQRAHILIAHEKSDFSLNSTAIWLGHQFNLKEGHVEITEKRILRCEEKMQMVLRKWPFISARDLARVVGSLISMFLVLREEVQFMTRYLQQAINYREEIELSWSKIYDINETGVGERAKIELLHWISNLRKFNIRKFNPDKKQCKIVFGDAGDKGEGAYFDFGLGKQVFHSRYSKEESKESSTFRELSAVHDLFLSVPDQLARSTVVYTTDSMSCHIILMKGSRNKKLHEKAAACRGLARAINTELLTAWVPREYNQEADDISKQIDWDCWGITPIFFQKVQTLCGQNFTLDAFADDRNSHLPKFYSKYWCPGSAGVSSLSQDWRGECVLAVPPPSLLTSTLWKFVESGVRGMLVYPECAEGVLKGVWENKKICRGRVTMWKFPGRGSLHAEVETSYNESYTGRLVVNKLNFT